MSVPGAIAAPPTNQDSRVYSPSTKIHRRAHNWGQNDTDDGGEDDWEGQSAPAEEQPDEEEADRQQSEYQGDPEEQDSQQEPDEGVVWASPTEDESLAGGAILMASWTAAHDLGDIQFSLCVSDDQPSDSEDSDDQCGRAVTPRVNQDEDGVHSMNVTMPDLDAASGFFLRLLDADGTAYDSPVFTLTPSQSEETTESSPVPVDPVAIDTGQPHVLDNKHSGGHAAGRPSSPDDLTAPPTPANLVPSPVNWTTPAAPPLPPMPNLSSVTMASSQTDLRVSPKSAVVEPPKPSTLALAIPLSLVVVAICTALAVCLCKMRQRRSEKAEDAARNSEKYSYPFVRNTSPGGSSRAVERAVNNLTSALSSSTPHSRLQHQSMLGYGRGAAHTVSSGDRYTDRPRKVSRVDYANLRLSAEGVVPAISTQSFPADHMDYSSPLARAQQSGIRLSFTGSANNNPLLSRRLPATAASTPEPTMQQVGPAAAYREDPNPGNWTAFGEDGGRYPARPPPAVNPMRQRPVGEDSLVFKLNPQRQAKMLEEDRPYGTSTSLRRLGSS